MKLKVRCSNCDECFTIDPDDLESSCPSCGEQLIFDTEQISVIYAAREKTKRYKEKTKQKQLAYEHETRMQKNEQKKNRRETLAYIVIMLILLLFCVFSFYKMERQEADERLEHLARNEIQVTVSSKDIEGKNYEAVVRIFESAGFTSIELHPEEDVIFGIFIEDGEVENVTINGEDEFSEGDWYPKDAHIEITYHAMKN